MQEVTADYEFPKYKKKKIKNMKQIIFFKLNYFLLLSFLKKTSTLTKKIITNTANIDYWFRLTATCRE